MYQGTLSTSYLNVDGLTDAKLADVVAFTDQRSPDVLFLMETKRRVEEIGSNINIDGYELIEIRRSDTADANKEEVLLVITRTPETLSSKLVPLRFPKPILHMLIMSDSG